MEDRYLFCGKRIDNGEWVQGFLSVHTFIPSEEEFEKSGKETYLAPVIESVPERIYDHDVYEVDPSTICQCTGLKDKNGKLIWENDIVKDKNGNLYKAFWQDNYYQFSWICIKSNSLPVGAKWDFYSIKSFEIEVIDNVFDNPELLG